MSLHSSSRLLTKAIGLGTLFAALSSVALAQVAITDVTYTTTPGTPTTTVNYYGGNDFTFQNTTSQISSVSTFSGTYAMNTGFTPSVYLRRAAALGNYVSTVYLQKTGTNETSLLKPSTVENLFTGNNTSATIANVFNNTNGSGFERIDVYYGTDYTVAASDALVFFDVRLDLGDSFRIVPILEWDTGSSTPTSYASNGTQVNTSAFGDGLQFPNGDTSTTVYSATYNTGGNLSGSPLALVEVANVGLRGVLVRMSDLGLSDGDIIKGFSLMAGDVVISANPNDLLDYTNTAVYNPNTNSAWGSMDFTNFTTSIASPVPEPSTYGALMTAGALGFFAWRRRRQARVA